MTIVVLLSRGVHPVSGRACPVTVETQAIRLGLSFAASSGPASQAGAIAATATPLIGLHAGPDSALLRDYGGHGLAELHHLRLPAEADPAEPLAAAIRALAPTLILAGRRGCGGADTGLLPYRIAAHLGLPLCADAIALSPCAHGLVAEQALPRGVRRRVTLALPAIITVHPAAPAPLPFAYAQARNLRIAVQDAAPQPNAFPAPEERPYRARPRYLAPAASFAGSGARLLVDPHPDQAAAAILDALSSFGVHSGT